MNTQNGELFNRPSWVLISIAVCTTPHDHNHLNSNNKIARDARARARGPPQCTHLAGRVPDGQLHGLAVDGDLSVEVGRLQRGLLAIVERVLAEPDQNGRLAHAPLAQQHDLELLHGLAPGAAAG